MAAPLIAFAFVAFSRNIIDGATRAVREGASFPVVDLVEYRESGLDYAIIRLGTNGAGQFPGDVYGTLLVALNDVDEPRSTLCVIQHPTVRRSASKPGRCRETRPDGSSTRISPSSSRSHDMFRLSRCTMWGIQF